MPYNKEQLKAYWQANKEVLNQKRRQKRRLAKFGLATEEVSHETGKVSHSEVSQLKMANPANFNQVSHSLPSLKMANPNLKVSHGKPENGKPFFEMASLKLTRLIKEWQTQTNYKCASTCAYSYCNNCWYFAENRLIDYKKEVAT
ncbi:MAG: hypothetical protein MRECE_11c045 [Mycoplasmataceae bacterium CE_OT135]|nr:MAG: hypothetical protein MRECE_11c045 [Mycoplasmataceae bacterium CE_OT135]